MTIGGKCSHLFLAGNYSNKLLIVTLLLLAGDVEVNPGPGGSSFPCGLCEMMVEWRQSMQALCYMVP